MDFFRFTDTSATDDTDPNDFMRTAVGQNKMTTALRITLSVSDDELAALRVMYLGPAIETTGIDREIIGLSREMFRCFERFHTEMQGFEMRAAAISERLQERATRGAKGVPKSEERQESEGEDGNA